jgi:hypothetical protein
VGEGVGGIGPEINGDIIISPLHSRVPSGIGSSFPGHAVFGKFLGVMRILGSKDFGEVQKGSYPFLDFLILEIFVFDTLLF